MLSVLAQEEDCRKNIRPELTAEITTLWDYPFQSYGERKKGDNRFPGVTPAFVIRNLITRYTEPGDLVVDCMAGSGTTIDVAREENRRVIGYDIAAIRSDIIQNDARNLPLEDECVDLHFVDSPYSDNIHYSNHPDCIGKIPCENDRFFEELGKIVKEIHRTLKLGGILGWLIADQFRRRRFTPVGFKLFDVLSRYLQPVDIIAVRIHNQRSNNELWQRRAIKYNFFLRGFKYLFIMRKVK
ncbi:MAG: TRM11 family SAM-dependent methyltransferase [Thermoplasmata archaeon]